MFTATRLVDTHREQGNCVYLDMQGHGRPEKPQRRLQGGLCPYCDYVHVIPVPLNNQPFLSRSDLFILKSPFLSSVTYDISHFLPQLITNDIVLKLCIIVIDPPPRERSQRNYMYYSKFLGDSV